jgi:hypothetical protein
MNRVQKKLKDRTALLDADGDNRPDAFTPTSAGLAPRPLDDMRSGCGQVVGWLDARRDDECFDPTDKVEQNVVQSAPMIFLLSQAPTTTQI